VEPIDHCVFMGMGEPLLSLEPVLEAGRRVPDIGITHRRTTISTVGWLPGLRRFIDEVEEPIRLALSLHAADGALRSQLMPVNDRYPLTDVLAECRRYVELRGRKVFVEYVMLAGVLELAPGEERGHRIADIPAHDGEKPQLVLAGVLRIPGRLLEQQQPLAQAGERAFRPLPMAEVSVPEHADRIGPAAAPVNG